MNEHAVDLVVAADALTPGNALLDADGVGRLVVGAGHLSDGTVLLDLTGDTVTPETLMAGVIAHNAAGERIVGICVTKV